MSPCATATAEGYLEHPAEAFAYFAEHGVERVVCEQKHMGSRALVIVGRSAYRPWRSAPGSPVVICIRQIVWLAIVFASRESTR